MDEKEKAAEAERAAKLRKDLDGMSAEQVREYAKRLALDISGLTKREDVEDLIERHEYALAGKARLEAMERAEQERVAREPDKRTRLIRALNAQFCAAVPQAARSGAYFADDDADGTFDGSYDVPDGKYRVTGSDWIFTIRKRKLFEAVQASAANNYGGKDVIQIES